jgi:hypothetical protein
VTETIRDPENPVHLQLMAETPGVLRITEKHGRHKIPGPAKPMITGTSQVLVLLTIEIHHNEMPGIFNGKPGIVLM